MKPTTKSIYIFSLLLSLTITTSSLAANSIIEPKTKTEEGVAITIDMCDGDTDISLINTLIKYNIKATFFVTSKWLKGNEKTVSLLNLHPELFRVENHGEKHLAPLIESTSPYKIKKVGSLEVLNSEVNNSKNEITNKFTNLNKPEYYRGAGAQYDNKSIQWLKENNLKIGGYTIAADGGARFPPKLTLLKLETAKSGDVILIHGNHPNSGNSIAMETYISNKNPKDFVWLN